MDQRIWLGILESERYYRYYHDLAHKIRRQQLRSDVVLFIAAGGVVATLISHYLQGPSETMALLLLTSIVGGIAVGSSIEDMQPRRRRPASLLTSTSPSEKTGGVNGIAVAMTTRPSSPSSRND